MFHKGGLITKRFSHHPEDGESKTKKLKGIFHCETSVVCRCFLTMCFVCAEEMEEGSQERGTL